LLPKPKHLTTRNAARFQEKSVVDFYHLRLPYPPETFDILLSLMDSLRCVLDVGTGTGEIARNLIASVDRVDAVDLSPAMLEKGRVSPNGDHPNLRWIQGRLEEVELYPPYGLIVGADSLHWMDWQTVFPRFHDLLTPDGYVVILGRSELPPRWQDDLLNLIRRFSLMQNWQPFDLIEQLQKRDLFQLVGEKTTQPVTSKQSIEDYINSFHSRSSLSIEGMQPEDVREFDRRLRELVAPHSENGFVVLQTQARLHWGKPQRS
jgi:ubiquinone/menaquinone biosynthesis C-methylase UbiE